MNKEKLMDLLNEFSTNGISKEADKLQPVLDFQDIIGRASMDETIGIYLELNEREKELFDFACLHCLDRAFNRELMRKLYVKDVQNSCMNINNIKRDYETKLSELGNAIEQYQKQVVELTNENYDLKNDLSNLKTIFNKY